MKDFKKIEHKLEQFIRRYYTNDLLKGIILFFTLGVLYFLIILFIEHLLWLSSGVRTFLFWFVITVEVLLLVKFIIIPLAKLLKLRKRINYEEASKIIGNHFPEVNDKLLNVLQLQKNASKSELLLASIEQKSIELNPVPFKLAINLKQNFKYLKYALIPLLILLISFATGHINWFSDSYKRVVNYQMAYEPPAPFQFFVINDSLNVIENKDYRLQIAAEGDLIPENAQIHYNNESYFLQQTDLGKFEYVFSQPTEAIDFQLSANKVNSKPYTLNIIKAPLLVNFEMHLNYPYYLKKKNEILKSTGNTTVPEGTMVTWHIKTKTTSKVALYAKDTVFFKAQDENYFKGSKRLYDHFNYTISTSNPSLKDYENLPFSISVIKDGYPELNLQMKKDSIDQKTLYFYGQVNDDYGLSKLQLVYYPIGENSNKQYENIPISNSNVDEFVSAFPNQIQLKEGVNYELYFEIFDNDALHNYKSVKSNTFTYRKITKEEEEKLQLLEQKETIKNLGNSFKKLQEQDELLKELSKTQKEKQSLNFNDKKKLENFLKRQKQQEELMQNFNKQLKEKLDEYQNESDDPFKENLKKRLNDNEKQLRKDEKLLEELEKLEEKINKEELTEKLDQLAKQNKNKEKSLEQLLELTKRYYVTKKAEKLQKELEQLAKDQEELSKQNDDKNTKNLQEDLNKQFEYFVKDIEELQKENKELKDPMDFPKNKEEEEDIKKDQQEATEELKKKEEQGQGNEQKKKEHQKNAKKSQQKAAQKMKQMSLEMMEMMEMGAQEQLSEDIETLRQILDNLVVFSFQQEDLMDTFGQIETNNNQYSKQLRKQSNLRTHFEHIDDSLFALTLRQPKLSENINKEITDVFFNIDKSIMQFSENQTRQGIAAQQYTITAANNLADFLSDVLDNLQADMSSTGEGEGECKGGNCKGGSHGKGGQLPDIIMSQEDLNKQMKEGLEKSKQGQTKDGKEGKKGGSKVGEDGESGKGEGGKSEELNGELYQIFKQQQQLRQAVEDMMKKLGGNNHGNKLIKDMENIELELINKGFNEQTLQKMMQLEHQLLKLENATFTQGIDHKRESETNREDHKNTTKNVIPTAKSYFNTTEILNKQALPFQQRYKKKIQDYFKTTDD